MPSLANVAVGADITATNENAEIAAINAIASNVVTPTSVAGTGVSLSGANVVVSAATSVSINGCFTSAYAWYEVEFDLANTTAVNLTAQLRLAGTDATTAYDNQRHSAINATSFPAQTLNAASFPATIQALAGRHTGIIKLYGPAVAAATIGTVFSGVTGNPMTTSAAVYVSFVQHRTLTAYDGISFAVASGNLTGMIKVRGIL